MNSILNFFLPVSWSPVTFIIVLAFIATTKKPINYFELAWRAIILFSVDYFLLSFLRLIGFSLFTWNWEGKFAEITLALFVIYVLNWMSPKEAGLISSKGKTMLYTAILGFTIAFLLVLKMVITNDLPPKNILNIQTILYQMTMPGLAEELFYRGVLLGLFNSYLKQRWQYLTVKWSLGCIFVSLLFIAGHIVFPRQGMPLSPCLNSLSVELISMSLIFIFLRQKTGSIWPGVLCHNLVNALPLVFIWLFSTL